MNGFAWDDLELHPVRIAMRHRFRRVDHRESVLIKGPAGWGEFSPFPDYPPEVAARWLASALESALIPLPDPVRQTVPINVTVPAVDADTARGIVAASGCATAKVKVAEPGQTLTDDLARLDAVRQVLGPDGKVRIDVNGAWDVATAVDTIERMSEFDLEYVEQPVPTIAEMRQVRDRVGVPIAADESVRTASDPAEVVEAGGADILVLKVQPLGGVIPTLELAAGFGLPVVVSSALETSVGMAAGVRAAACLPDLDYACGLGTVTMLCDDVVSASLVPEDGSLRVERPEPDPDLIERLRPEPDVVAELMRRLRAAAEVLA